MFHTWSHRFFFAACVACLWACVNWSGEDENVWRMRENHSIRETEGTRARTITQGSREASVGSFLTKGGAGEGGHLGTKTCGTRLRTNVYRYNCTRWMREGITTGGKLGSSEPAL